MNATNDPILDGLPAQLRSKYLETSRQFIPSVQKLKFMGLEIPEGITSEAQRLIRTAEQAQRDWKEIHNTHWRLQADQTATEGGRLVRSASAANLKLKSASAAWEQSMAAAEERLNQLDRTLTTAAEPPSHAGKASVDAELRAILRSMPSDKAADLWRSDPAVRAAAARAPAAASGLLPDSHRAIRSQYLAETVPDEFAAANDLRASIGVAGRAMQTLVNESSALIDFKSAEALSARSAAAV